MSKKEKEGAGSPAFPTGQQWRVRWHNAQMVRDCISMDESGIESFVWAQEGLEKGEKRLNPGFLIGRKGEAIKGHLKGEAWKASEHPSWLA